MAPLARMATRLPLLAALLCLGCDAGVGDADRPATAGRAASLDTVPNVLLVSIDTLRADRVGAFGASQAVTPTLDRLAAEGVRFDQAISPAPLTLPSHATLLTGMDPPRHGVRHNGIHRLPESLTTLAERFQEAGHETGAVVGAAVLSARQGLGQGFDHYDDAIVPRDGRLGGAAAQRDARAVSEAARTWLARTQGPFFLFVHYYDPHASYQPPPPFDGFEHPYDGEIAYVDHELGRLLADLERSGRLDDTLVVVTADHGESLGEHDEATHAYSVYDATQRVPLLMWGPGLPEGAVVDEVVRLADVAPTLLARTGLPALAAQAELDGRDLSPWLDGSVERSAERSGLGASGSSRTAYVESMATQIDQGWAPLHGMRSGRALFIDAPRPELYDLASDPGQLHNRIDAPSQAATRAELRAALEAHLQESAEAETLALDPATRAQLEALGYALPPEAGLEPGAAEAGPLIDPKDGLVAHRAYHEAELHLAAGRLEEAALALDRLLEAHPRSAPAHGKRAVVALRSGDAPRARRHARRAAELQPHSAPYWQQLGVIERETGRARHAREAFEHGLRLDPDSGVGHLEHMETCAILGDEACMASAESAALRLVGHNVVALRRMADAWEAAGARERALAAYRRVLVAAPDSPRDHMHAAIHAAALGDREASEAHLARAGSVRDDPRARRLLAEARASGAQGVGKP
ncbi:MAG: sulfatase-like hydrolase/transferase [Myxococcota bacterium]|nr:sulfatase-like hydrolase/transferase [Myxococcota bacterium]